MRRATLALVAVLALAVPAAALGGAFTLYPTGFGADTYSAWRAMEGQADSTGDARQALYLQKGVAEAGPAAVATVRGFEGQRVQALTGLNYEYRKDGYCDAFSPRWTLVVQGKSRKRYVVRLGCSTGIRSGGSAPGWIRVQNTQPLIRARILGVGGNDALFGTIESIALVFDPPRFARTWLDNIAVLGKGIGTSVWTCAADNGSAPADTGGFRAAELALDQAMPLAADELSTAEELMASLTPEETVLIESEEDPAPAA